MVDRYLLTINTGSSSIKAALYRLGEKESRELFAEAERIGLPHSLLRFQDARGDTFEEQRIELPDHAAALRALLDQLGVKVLDRDLLAVGHRSSTVETATANPGELQLRHSITCGR